MVRRAIAARIASGSRAGTTSALTSCCAYSQALLSSGTMTGTPQAIASTAETGEGSLGDEDAALRDPDRQVRSRRPSMSASASCRKPTRRLQEGHGPGIRPAQRAAEADVVDDRSGQRAEQRRVDPARRRSRQSRCSGASARMFSASDCDAATCRTSPPLRACSSERVEPLPVDRSGFGMVGDQQVQALAPPSIRAPRLQDRAGGAAPSRVTKPAASRPLAAIRSDHREGAAARGRNRPAAAWPRRSRSGRLVAARRRLRAIASPARRGAHAALQQPSLPSVSAAARMTSSAECFFRGCPSSQRGFPAPFVAVALRFRVEHVAVVDHVQREARLVGTKREIVLLAVALREGLLVEQPDAVERRARDHVAEPLTSRTSG